MPLVQRILMVIRTLMDEEPPPSRKKKKKSTSPGFNSSSRQAVALVVAFRDLFTSGHLNVILEDIEANRRSSKYHHSIESHLAIGQPTATSSPLLTHSCKSLPEISFNSKDLPVSSTVWPLVLERVEETVPLLHEEKIISSPRVDFRNTDTRFMGSENRELVLYTKTISNNKSKSVTVSLMPSDEKQTVNVLREVLKWSPRKQSTVSFSVPLPKSEKHQAVAVVQNAVNRVKEENLKKKKRRWKFLKFTFC